MSTLNHILAAILVCTLSISCGLSHDYNLAINPPGEESLPEEIFPSEINGDTPQSNSLEGGGLEVMYGKDKSIIVARLSSNEEAKAYFQQRLMGDFKAQPSNFSGTINGQFYAKAGGGSWKKFGWVNQNYAFAIKAADDEGLAQVVEAFKYIEPEE